MVAADKRKLLLQCRALDLNNIVRARSLMRAACARLPKGEPVGPRGWRGPTCMRWAPWASRDLRLAAMSLGQSGRFRGAHDKRLRARCSAPSGPAPGEHLARAGRRNGLNKTRLCDGQRGAGRRRRQQLVAGASYLDARV